MRYAKLCKSITILFVIATVSARAQEEKRTYLHRSRGEDLRAVNVFVTPMPDGSHSYRIDDFIGGNDNAYEFIIGRNGAPMKYFSKGGGHELSFLFTNNSVVCSRKKPEQEAVTRNIPLDQGVLPDFNSRPDPYLTEHLLVHKYDFDKAGKQGFTVFDIDNTGDGIAMYEISLELLPEDSVLLPNGRFKARHLVKLQQSSASTWYKKRRGSQTDIWVDDQGTVLRIYRHREPYELVLQNYGNIANQISKDESAQGYQQPTVLAP